MERETLQDSCSGDFTEFEKSMRAYSYESRDDDEGQSERGTFLVDLLGIHHLTNSLYKEYKNIVFELHQSILGNRFYHIAWALYVILMSLVGGLILNLLDNGSFMDSWFDAASCLVNSGLTVVSITDRSNGAIATMALLMLSGSGALLLLPTLIYRCHILKKLLPRMTEHLNRTDISRSAKSIIWNHKLLYDGSVLMIWIIVLYMAIFVVGGALLLYACLASQSMEPYLQEKGYSHWENAMMTAVSAFTNSGMGGM